MKLNFTHIFMVLFTVFLFTACTKKDETYKLPLPTSEGKNSFGCLMNGVAWMPQNNEKAVGENLQFFYDPAEGLSIKAIKIDQGVEEFIYITLKDCNRTGKYSMDGNNMSVSYTNYKNENKCITLYSRNPEVKATGSININRFDPYSGIISGSFDLNISRTGCSDIVLSNGRFDGKF